MASRAKSGIQSLGAGMRKQVLISAIALAVCAAAAFADDQKASGAAEFIFDGTRINIEAASPDASKYASIFASLTPSCDPDCITAPSVADGIETVIEPQVLDFLVSAVGRNEGLLVDARMPDDRRIGFIPGSVSLPHETLAPENEFQKEILKALGARAFEDVFNFADAQKLVVFDNGPTQNDAALLIAHLLEAGYPSENIRYYRGGMQVWSVIGLTVQE